MHDGDVVGTDNGNYILDCKIAPLAQPEQLEADLRAIPGIVGTGLFLGMADTVLLGDDRFNLAAERQRTIPNRRDAGRTDRRDAGPTVP